MPGTCRMLWWSGVPGNCQDETSRVPQANTDQDWPCVGRAQHRNGGTGPVHEGKRALIVEPHNSVSSCDLCHLLSHPRPPREPPKKVGSASPGWPQPAELSPGCELGRARRQGVGRTGLSAFAQSGATWRGLVAPGENASVGGLADGLSTGAVGAVLPALSHKAHGAHCVPA